MESKIFQLLEERKGGYIYDLEKKGFLNAHSLQAIKEKN